MTEPTLAERMKRLLPDPTMRIQLDDLVTDQVRNAITALGPNRFPLRDPEPSPGTIAQRVDEYRLVVSDLMTAAILFGRWGTIDHSATFRGMLSRLTEANVAEGGQYAWLGLRWYPLELIYYCAGIAALSTDNWSVMAELYRIGGTAKRDSQHPGETFIRLVEGLGDADRVRAFHLLPGHEQHRTPRSDLLFELLQPVLAAELFLGASYETLFDRFEAVHALQFAGYGLIHDTGRMWGPVGRFAWKYDAHRGGALVELEEEATLAGTEWPLLKFGVFSRGSEFTLGLMKRFREDYLAHLSWY